MPTLPRKKFADDELRRLLDAAPRYIKLVKNEGYSMNYAAAIVGWKIGVRRYLEKIDQRLAEVSDWYHRERLPKIAGKRRFK